MEEKYCNRCVFRDTKCDDARKILGNCSVRNRSDKKSVIFKKLEKVGEPITVNGKNVQFLKTTIANCDNCAFYKDVNCDFTCYPRKCHGGEEGTYVEIKQNKEDMEEKNNAKHSNSEKIGKNLKPFDLEAAKVGKPVCTRDGRKARIICFDRDWDMHIVALVTDPLGESVHYYLSNGKVDFDKQNDEDLMMLPEKRIGWININKDTGLFKSKEEAERDCTKDYVPVRVEFEI